jgi:hypothetical protein
VEALLTASILTGVIFAFYQRGKQTGSRGGFHAGRRRGRREAKRRLLQNKSARRERPEGKRK